MAALLKDTSHLYYDGCSLSAQALTRLERFTHGLRTSWGIELRVGPKRAGLEIATSDRPPGHRSRTSPGCLEHSPHEVPTQSPRSSPRSSVPPPTATTPSPSKTASRSASGPGCRGAATPPAHRPAPRPAPPAALDAA